MNNKGVITIEGLIAFSAFLLVMVLIISMFHYYAYQDLVAQIAYDSVLTSEIVHFAYHVISPEDWIKYESYIPEPLLPQVAPIIEQVKTLVSDEGFEIYLENYLKVKYKEHDIEIEPKVSLKDGYLELELDYDYSMPFNFNLEDQLFVHKALYLYGVGGQKPSMALNKETKYVYVTKSGSKYHEANCFYLTRSTTDKEEIRKITLEEAQKSYSPCRRCMIKEVDLWK
ncbi:MAG: hypothetical protein JXR88_13570 [Clostridia bacterium]|nr:hypothetical protein [Clostridia bacterium]